MPRFRDRLRDFGHVLLPFNEIIYTKRVEVDPQLEYELNKYKKEAAEYKAKYERERFQTNIDVDMLKSVGQLRHMEPQVAEAYRNQAASYQDRYYRERDAHAYDRQQHGLRSYRKGQRHGYRQAEAMADRDVADLQRDHQFELLRRDQEITEQGQWGYVYGYKDGHSDARSGRTPAQRAQGQQRQRSRPQTSSHKHHQKPHSRSGTTQGGEMVVWEGGV